MGFFFSDEEQKQLEKKEKPRKEKTENKSKKTRKVELDPDKVGCDACPLQSTWSSLLTPRMPLAGSKDSEILILGEAPGEHEDLNGVPFVGESGELLRKHIPKVDLESIAWQNIVRCRPPGNITPEPEMIHACNPYLEEDIASLPNLKCILGFGSIPFRRFYPKGSITTMHGLRMPVQIADKTLWYYPVMHPSYILRTGGEKSSSYPLFKTDLSRFFTKYFKWRAPEVTIFSPSSIIMPKSLEEAEACLATMSSPLGIDLETTKLRPYAKGALVLTAAISDGKITMAFPISWPGYETDWGLEFVLRVAATRSWVAHNLAFELVYIWYHSGNRNIYPFHDTMALARLNYERNGVLGLEDVSRLELGVDVKSLSAVNARHLLDYDLSDALVYNGFDAQACALIFNRMYPDVHISNYKRLISAVASTVYMQLEGLPINRVASLSLKEEFEAEAKHQEFLAQDLYEVKMFKRSRGEFNIASAQHVGIALVEYGKLSLPWTAKQYSTDDEVLSRYKDHPLVKCVLAYRNAAKAASTYVEPVIAAVENSVDNLSHPCYTTMHTATGRTSSEDFNIQNWPKRNLELRKLRRQIALPKGHVFLAADYGQLEVRVLGMASKDRALIKDILDGVDMHTRWLERVLNVYPQYLERLAALSGETDEGKLKKVGRNTIKMDFVFSSFYGATSYSIADRALIPLPLVQGLHKQLWSEYKGVRAWHKKVRQEYLDLGVSRSLTGRVRRQVLGGNEPINNPIQGTGSDLVIDAQNELSELSRRLREPCLHPRINIHDDLTFIIKDDEKLPEYIEIIAQAMTRVRYDWQCVPLAVEFSVSDTTWDKLEPIHTFFGDYVK